ncbi:LLM class flavin-dependent oxidoreductase [Streptomyces sp. ISL-10]|nr:LLM class flavin-dependent oxidoreductase [Streptomyces sp. ISL-10]
MGSTTALGAVFRPQLPPERLPAMARAADAAGLEELWLWEDCFPESGIATAAAALAWTERLRVGVGLLPVPLRNVALTSMKAATLLRLFSGRVTPALGHGVQDWMGQVGARVESPLTLLREHLAGMRALLGGERMTVEGRYVRLDGVALDWPPTAAPPVLADALGPKSLRAVGRSGRRDAAGGERVRRRRAPGPAAHRRGTHRGRTHRAPSGGRLRPRRDRTRRRRPTEGRTSRLPRRVGA